MISAEGVSDETCKAPRSDQKRVREPEEPGEPEERQDSSKKMLVETEPTRTPSGEETCQFSICFTSYPIFLQALQIINSIMSDVVFFVTSEQEGTDPEKPYPCFFRMGSMDPSATCACKMKLKCVGYKQPGETTFAVNVSQLLTIIKSQSFSEHPMRVYQFVGDNRVYVTSAEENSCRYHIPMIEMESQDLPFHDILSDRTLSFGLLPLKNHLKTLASLKTDVIRLKMFNGHSDQQMVLCMESDGESVGSQWYLPVTRTVSNINTFEVEKGLTPIQTGDEVHDSAYPLEFLKRFIGSITGNRDSTVLFRVCTLPNGEPALVLEYEFGQEDSTIRFVLASRHAD